ncbi:AN1-type zinc finger protein 5-like [Grus japonensis]|uniref:AN1-type zinc finger protein 5-like n=1 Tax=Grus japonensis TaxID=30415 RepID=A0ABC9WJ98_GRUJA
MDSLLPKAEPTSGAGGISVTTYLRKCEKCCTADVRERSEKDVRETDTKVSAEGGAGGAPGTRAKIPLQPMVKAMVRQAVSLQPMEVDCRADIHLQPMEDPMPEQLDVP